MGASGQVPAGGQRDGHVWTSRLGPGTSFLEAQDGGIRVGVNVLAGSYSTQAAQAVAWDGSVWVPGPLLPGPPASPAQ